MPMLIWSVANLNNLHSKTNVTRSHPHTNDVKTYTQMNKNKKNKYKVTYTLTSA